MSFHHFAINGESCDELVTETGYTVSYVKRKGSNSKTMLDGSIVDDTLAVKAVVTCYFKPMREQSDLLRILTSVTATYVYLYYYDPRVGDYRSIIAVPSEASQKYCGENPIGVDYWSGTVITFTEK